MMMRTRHQCINTPLKKVVLYISIENNAKNAVASAFGWMPDLILLDIIMEDMDGIEVLQKLKEMSTQRIFP